MITFYCTNCWAEVPKSATICQHCGDDIAARRARADFVDKLIAALHHPEPTTRLRAAWLRVPCEPSNLPNNRKP